MLQLTSASLVPILSKEQWVFQWTDLQRRQDRRHGSDFVLFCDLAMILACFEHVWKKWPKPRENKKKAKKTKSSYSARAHGTNTKGFSFVRLLLWFLCFLLMDAPVLKWITVAASSEHLFTLHGHVQALPGNPARNVVVVCSGTADPLWRIDFRSGYNPKSKRRKSNKNATDYVLCDQQLFCRKCNRSFTLSVFFVHVCPFHPICTHTVSVPVGLNVPMPCRV